MVGDAVYFFYLWIKKVFRYFELISVLLRGIQLLGLLLNRKFLWMNNVMNITSPPLYLFYKSSDKNTRPHVLQTGRHGLKNGTLSACGIGNLLNYRLGNSK